ncbi:MAG: hypothetical protein Fur0037_12660 [Planctomycetota bacterium]
MKRRPPGTLRVLGLLARTSVLRVVRGMQVARSRRARRSWVRGATPRRKSNGFAILLIAMLPLFLFESLAMTAESVRHLAVAAQRSAHGPDRLAVSGRVYDFLVALQPAMTDEGMEDALRRLIGRFSDDPPVKRVAEQYRRTGIRGFARAERAPPPTFLLMDRVRFSDPRSGELFAAAGALVLLGVLALLISIGLASANANLAGGEWTFAWLMTFPVRTTSLVVAKALEYSIVQFLPWLVLFPLLLQILRAQGRHGSPWLAAAGTLATAFLAGSIRLWVETSLRMKLTLRGLRSIQGLCAILSLSTMALLFSIGFGRRTPDWFLDLARSAPRWIRWLPGAWPMEDGPLALIGASATAVAFGLSCLGTARLLSRGAMRSGGVDPGARGSSRSWAERTRALGIVGKDLAMLLRDRGFLVQTVVVPVFAIGIQWILNPGLGDLAGRGAALVAYGIGSYSLIGGCFQVLSAEGRSLWVLYTLPARVADMLRGKVRIWAATAISFAAGALLLFSFRATSHPDPVRLLSDLFFVGAGVAAAAHIAAGIGVIGADPTADYVPRQAKARHVYLFFFFAATYVAGLQSSDIATRAACLLVFATLAYAVWQRACDRLPWLLDPVAEDRSRIGSYDGAVALVVFFALQLLITVFAAVRNGRPPGTSLADQLLPFAIAGAFSAALAWALLAARGIPVARALGFLEPRSPAPAAMALGALAGSACGAVGAGYQRLIGMAHWIEIPPIDPGDRLELLLLAAVAAPLVEEILFRGLLFAGLSRGTRAPLAVLWSSAVFAAVHPPLSWPPVFLLGVAAALVFARTRFLPAAMAAHSAYNLIVLGLAP